MSKSILVFETPNKCSECIIPTICKDRKTVYCKVKPQIIEEYSIRPDWCPLRNLPEKEDCKNYLDDDAEAYCNRWNSCIDKILGD